MYLENTQSLDLVLIIVVFHFLTKIKLLIPKQSLDALDSSKICPIYMYNSRFGSSMVVFGVLFF